MDVALRGVGVQPLRAGGFALSFLIKSIELHNYSTNRKRHSTARSGILFCAL